MTLVPRLRRVGKAGRAALRTGAQPIRSVRLSLDANLRRIEPHRQHRIRRSLLGAALVVAVALVVSVVLHTWIVVAAVVVVFAIQAALLAWRSRPHRGRAEHWPVGDVHTGPDAFLDDGWFSRRAAKYGPVFKTNVYERPTCCITDLPLATTVLREHADDLGPPWGPYEDFVPGGSIRGADRARNAELRRVYAQTLTAALVRSWEPQLVHRIATDLTALAAAPDSTIDGAIDGVNPRPALRALTRAAFSEVLLGIAPESGDFAEANALLLALHPDRPLFADALPRAETEAGLDRLAGLIRRAATTRHRVEIPATWADRLAEVVPGALDDPALVRNLIYTTITSSEDVAGFLVWVLWHLTDQTVWVDRLRAALATDGLATDGLATDGLDPDGFDPDALDTADGLADRIVSETLRLQQSENVMRTTVQDFAFDGVVVPRPWFVRVCIRELHRDPANFASPETFDPDRFLGDRVGRDRYAPFGIDHRFCLGEQLTRTVGRVFALDVARGLDVVTTRDGPPEMSQQRHWAPSSRWRITLRQRQPPRLDT